MDATDVELFHNWGKCAPNGIPQTNPCDWSGIYCNGDGNIKAISLWMGEFDENIKKGYVDKSDDEIYNDNGYGYMGRRSLFVETDDIGSENGTNLLSLSGFLLFYLFLLIFVHVLILFVNMQA